jgi:hypothetical protein
MMIHDCMNEKENYQNGIEVQDIADASSYIL